MIQSTLIKSLGVSTITGSFVQLLRIFLLYINVSAGNTLIISSIVSYIIVYSTQRLIFNGGTFFGISLLKHCAVALITIEISYLLLHILQKNETIKSYIEDKTISDTRRKCYQYILINICILTIFFCIEYPFRKLFIFVKNKAIDYTYSYILYSIAIVMYLCFDYS